MSGVGWTKVSETDYEARVVGLCRDCKHWLDADDAKRLGAKDWRICDRAEEPGKAKLVGYGNQQSWLATAPDFGCVQFEGRESQKATVLE